MANDVVCPGCPYPPKTSQYDEVLCPTHQEEYEERKRAPHYIHSDEHGTEY